MRKGRIIGGILAICFLTTGCMKINMSMDIRKDKSMDLTIIEAVDQNLLNQQGESSTSMDTSMLNEENKKELEKNGYKVENYSENSMVGYKISKTIKNIDDVSTEKEITSNIGLSNTSNQPIFMIKRGFFKNTYKAKIVSEDSNKVKGQLDTNIEDDYLEEETDEPFSSATLEEDNLLDDIDYSSMLSSMDMKFSVNVPYKALSSNATEISNDGKMLTWNLMELKENEMEFEFELYNLTNISVVAAIIDIILIIFIILLIIRAKKIRTH